MNLAIVQLIGIFITVWWGMVLMVITFRGNHIPAFNFLVVAVGIVMIIARYII